MAQFAAFIPYIMSAAGALQGGAAEKTNAAVQRQQSKVALSQGFADEEAQRREGRQQLGAQAAAMAENGVAGPTADGLLLQSSILAELDAQNIRYGGVMRSRGLLAESRASQQRGGQAGLLAGAQLLQGYGAYKAAK